MTREMEKGVIYRRRLFFDLLSPLTMRIFYWAANGRLPWAWNLFFTSRYTRFVRLLCASIFVADCLPWFARKPLLNWMVGREVLSDFVTSGQLTQPFSDICIKW